MYNPQTHAFCSEFYIVEKSIEVVVSIQGQSERIRIDALRREPSGDYSTKVYREEEFTLQPTFPQQNGQFVRNLESHRVWLITICRGSRQTQPMQHSSVPCLS